MKACFKFSFFRLALLCALTLGLTAPAFAAQTKPPARAASKAAAKPAKERHPLDGVWQPDLEASAQIAPLPARLPQDLRNLSMTVDTEAGKIRLAWADGAKREKDFKIISANEGIYTLSVTGGRSPLTIDATRQDRLIMKEGDNRLLFRRQAAPEKPAAPAPAKNAAKPKSAPATKEP